MEQNLNILLLEKLDEDAKLVESELKKIGGFSTKTLIVNNKADFIKSLTEFSPDIILSDHSLPDFNSIETLKIIKEMNLDIPFILTTRVVTVDFAIQVLREGAVDCILKSNLTRLPDSIIDILKKRESQRAAEKINLETLAHKRLLFHIENSPLGYIEWKIPELTVKTMSKRAEEIFGLTKDEVTEFGKTGYRLVYEEDMAMAKQKAQELIDGEVKNNTAQHRNYKKDGSLLYCEWFNSALKDEKGNVTAIMSLVQDITIRKEQEADILVSEERYRRIVETSQEGIWTIDENNLTNFVNEKICRLLKYSKDEMMGKHLFDFMDERTKELTIEVLESQKTEPRDSFECSFFTKTGNEIYTIISTNAIFGENHEYLGALAMVTDITERKRSELETSKLVEKLKEKNNDLQQFSFIVSHNLRSPLAKIQGLIHLFGNMQRDEAFNKLLLSNIARETINLDNVVKDMNTIITARNSSNLKKEIFLFEDNVKLIEDALQLEIAQSNAAITTDFHQAVCIETIKSYLYSIIYNLVSNAIKYRRPDTQLNIHIKTFNCGEFICLSVKDNGMGIDMNIYGDKLFGLYNRFHEETIPGRGIGLSLVKTQTESMGGKIEVESKAGLGSTFKIFLPKQ